MRSSTRFDWQRVVTPLRWGARIVGLAMAGFLGLVLLLNIAALGMASLDPVTGYVTWGLMFVGILVAAFWVGIGEVIGGLITVAGAALTFALVSTPNWGSFALLLPFLLVGVVFIACGWYTLAQGRLHTAHTPA